MKLFYQRFAGLGEDVFFDEANFFPDLFNFFGNGLINSLGAREIFSEFIKMLLDFPVISFKDFVDFFTGLGFV